MLEIIILLCDVVPSQTQKLAPVHEPRAIPLQKVVFDRLRNAVAVRWSMVGGKKERKKGQAQYESNEGGREGGMEGAAKLMAPSSLEWDRGVKLEGERCCAQLTTRRAVARWEWDGATDGYRVRGEDIDRAHLLRSSEPTSRPYQTAL